MIKAIKKLPQFFKEVREELKKVNWSTREELIAAVIIVVITSAIFTGYIFGVDIGLSNLVQFILK